MTRKIIVTGAAGRMGSTLVRMILASEDLDLAAAIDPHSESLRNLDSLCMVASDLENVIDSLPGAIIIDFTAPAAAMRHAQLAAARSNPIVIGTTGLSEAQKGELKQLAERTPILLSPNMSIGVNVLLEVLPELARMLGKDYDAELSEIHHKHKKDAPSGTALRLAEAVAEGKDVALANVARYHRQGIIGERSADEIGIQSLRGGDVVGVHTVYFMGPGERIEITHHAHSRENFAGGALHAARWLAEQKPGKLWSMGDVLKSQ
ncbi:MAG: 4-hydroxy-tetrahydrodipicolinate reductase [Mailhella sp.]|nr:4-hydroxy-tetrahydrodipicolinate reductase [Mailhella sp.]